MTHITSGPPVIVFQRKDRQMFCYMVILPLVLDHLNATLYTSVYYISHRFLDPGYSECLIIKTSDFCSNSINCYSQIWSIKPFFTGSHLGFKHIPSVTWGRVSYLPLGGGGGGNWQDKIPRWLHVKILLAREQVLSLDNLTEQFLCTCKLRSINSLS